MEAQKKKKKRPVRTQAARGMKSADAVQPESRHGAFFPTLEMITDNMSDMIRVTDLQGVNLYASSSHEKILGCKSEDRVGNRPLTFFTPTMQAESPTFFTRPSTTKNRSRSNTGQDTRRVITSGWKRSEICSGMIGAKPWR